MYEVSKRDWKLFREKVPVWQEAYMEKLNQKYVKILTDEKLDPSDRFWKLDARMKKDKRSPGVQMELSKGDMLWDLARLIKERVIKTEDLEEFSEEVKEAVALILNR